MENDGGHDLIVMGSSAGGVEALRRVLADLPADLPAAVLVVQHTSSSTPSLLAEILARAGPLPAELAGDGRTIRPGRVYVAQPDLHLLVRDGSMILRRGPRENRVRPAIDPLFRSAAVSYGPRVIGVVLTGYLDDGTAGLQAIVSCGGLAVVQHPDSAFARNMPESAIRFVVVDRILPLEQIAPELARLAALPPGPARPPSEQLLTEVRMAELDEGPVREVFGDASQFICPECGGSLQHLREGELHRYRCFTGHAFSESALLHEQSEALEEALYSALRALREKERLSEQLAERSKEADRRSGARAHQESAQQARNDIETIKRLLVKLMPPWQEEAKGSEPPGPPASIGTDQSG